jgi:hypothetical protein
MTAPADAPIQLADQFDPHVIIAIICVIVVLLIAALLIARLSEEADQRKKGKRR